MLRSIPVVPVGFPQLFEKSGQIKGEASYDIDLAKARTGSVAGHREGLHLDAGHHDVRPRRHAARAFGLLRADLVDQLSEHHDHAVPEAARRGRCRARWSARASCSTRGYKKLTGYESPKKGYEWFGGDPGHEALTAYGLMQFADMKDVYGAVDGAMLARTGAWLKSRRDGNGGYLRDAQGARHVRPRFAGSDRRLHHLGARVGRRDGPRQGDREEREARRDHAGRLPAGARHRHAAAAQRRRRAVEGRARGRGEARAHADGLRRVDQRRSLDHQERRRATCRSRPRRSRSSRCSRPTATWRKRARASRGCRTIAAASANGARRRPRCSR